MQLWDIDVNPELAIKGRFQRDEHGHEIWVLTAKRAWMFIEKQWVEQAQPEIFDDPIYEGEAGFSAMKHDHEFPVSRKNTDVIVVGKARAYAKRPTPYLECRLVVEGHIDKTIAVHGPRHWVEHGGTVTLSNPQAFIEKEVDYTHALGGDARNRVGGGIAEDNETLLKQVPPSVFYVNENWGPSNKQTRVAGFGPLPPFFQARYQYAGTFDTRWEELRRPLLPTDFDRRFYQSAPSDQQCDGFLKGGERVLVSGFCHDDVLSFRIPNERYAAVVTFSDGVMHDNLEMHTVFVDAENKTISISYSASFVCQGREHLLKTSNIVAV